MSARVVGGDGQLQLAADLVLVVAGAGQRDDPAAVRALRLAHIRVLLLKRGDRIPGEAEAVVHEVGHLRQRDRDLRTVGKRDIIGGDGPAGIALRRGSDWRDRFPGGIGRDFSFLDRGGAIFGFAGRVFIRLVGTRGEGDKADGSEQLQ